MKIEFNNEKHTLQQNVFNKKLDGYLHKGTVVPMPPKGTKSIGVIETSEGCFGVLGRDLRKLWLLPAVVVIVVAAYGVFSFATRGVDKLNYPVKFNENMTWSEGLVNVNLVNSNLPIQISIQGEGYTTDMYDVSPNEVLKNIELQVPLQTGDNKVKVIYTVKGKDYPFDAVVNVADGERPVEGEEIPVTPENPFETEVVIE